MSRRLRPSAYLIAAGLLATLASPARASTIYITYSAPGLTSPTFYGSGGICSNATICDWGLEDFTAWTTPASAPFPYTSDFLDGGSANAGTAQAPVFTGSYTLGTDSNGTLTTQGPGGELQQEQQNQYGGTNGGKYPELFGPGAAGGGASPANYVLTLSHSSAVPAIDYFGVWVSALDQYNDLKIYSGSTLIAEFDSAYLQSILGSSCPGGAYCGNPTSQDQGKDSSENFVYINVYDIGGDITSVDFYNSGSTGFESSNDAVGYINPATINGIVVTSTASVPEPEGLAVFGCGLAGLLLARAMWPTALRRLGATRPPHPGLRAC